jgi:hypothetical protein
MNIAIKQEEKSYIKRLSAFYFAAVWESFVRIFYLVFFAYFATFHSGKIILAIKYLFYTLKSSTLLLGVSYLFWGVIFIISLIIPFSVSVYAILLYYELWHSKWQRKQKIMLSLLLFFAVPLIIIIMDDVIRFVASQEELREFVVLNELKVSGK